MGSYASIRILRMTEHEHADMSTTRRAISFAAFVLSLAHTAAVHFGDIPDPVHAVRRPSRTCRLHSR